MKTYWFPLFLFLQITLLTVSGKGECPPHKKETKAVYRYFGDQAFLEAVDVPGEMELPSEHKPGDCFYRITEAGSVRGYLYSTRAMGRYDYFDYSIICSKDLVVIEVFINVYRSAHGAAICQKKWLSRFIGYQGEILKIGSDIDAVSGGTLSAASIVNDIQRCHRVMSQLLQPKQRPQKPDPSDE